MSRVSLTGLLLAACWGSPAGPGARGSAECADCHPEQAAAWSSSTHAGALRPAREALAGVPDGEVTVGGTTTRVSTAGGTVRLTVVREGLTESLVAPWAVGVEPLVQLLVQRDGGRWQVPDLAWDTRPASEGGQRWFTLQDEAAQVPGDPLHWDGPAFNANTMCLGCHTTGYSLGWQPEITSFATHWAAPSVGCEACHGEVRPGHAGGKPPDVSAGPGAWTFEPGARIAHRTAPSSPVAVETCAPCHALAAPISAAPVHPSRGGTLADSSRLVTLTQPAYGRDGAVVGEDFEVGPFLRSKMHAAGVTCGDCHDSHSGGLKAQGDALCATCHLPAAYSSEAHHHHEERASCVDCHMPAVTFMAVDLRHDHGLYVPRPDLAGKGGQPSACEGCHADRSSTDLAAAAAAWWGPPKRSWVDGLVEGSPGALAALAADGSVPAIVRAAALSRPEAPAEAWMAGVHDPSPLVQRVAAEALGEAPPAVRLTALPALLDSAASVAQAAAEGLADLVGALPPTTRAAVEAQLAALERALIAQGYTAEAQTRLCTLRARLGRLDEALEACTQAVERAPYAVGARLALADLHRLRGEETKAEAALLAGLTRVDDADLRHALGLVWVRQGRRAEGVDALLQAHRLRPDDPQLAYVAAVGLDELGRTEEARAVRAAAGLDAP